MTPTKDPRCPKPMTRQQRALEMRVYGIPFRSIARWLDYDNTQHAADDVWLALKDIL